ncbi:MAG: hypothetical protein ACK4NW_03895 [Roseinatronobacter sp.]
MPTVPFVAMVPGELAPLIALDLPDAVRGAARETVGTREVLDKLALSPRQMDLRPAPLGVQGGAWQSMLLASPTDIANWRHLTGDLGRNLRAILPDYLALPTSDGLWTVQTSSTAGGTVQMRFGPRDGLSAEPELAALALQRAVRDGTNLPRAVLLLGPALPVIDAAFGPLQDAVPDLVVVTQAQDLPAAIAAPQRFAHGELALDLGFQRPDAQTALRARLRGMMLPVILLAIAGLVWAGGIFWDVQRLEADVAAQQERNIALTRSYFLPEGPLPNIELQVARVVADRRAASDAETADLSHGLSVMRLASDALAEADISVQAMRLQTDQSVVIDLVSPDFTRLEALIEAFRDIGLSVVLDRSASEAEGGVLGTLTLGAGGPG